jgi:hypothetical protein
VSGWRSGAAGTTVCSEYLERVKVLVGSVGFFAVDYNLVFVEDAGPVGGDKL